MRIANGILPGPITPEEIERVKRLRDSGAVPPPKAKPADDGERLTSREMKALYSISGAKLLLASDAMDALTRRFKKLKLWWRYRGAVRTLQTCIDQVIESSDSEQKRSLPLKSVNMIASVHERKREDPQGLTTWVYIRDLNLVVRRVLDGHLRPVRAGRGRGGLLSAAESPEGHDDAQHPGSQPGPERVFVPGDDGDG